MSLYTLATASLISTDDHKRHPAMDVGTLVRTVFLCLACGVALTALYPSASAPGLVPVPIAASR